MRPRSFDPDLARCLRLGRWSLARIAASLYVSKPAIWRAVCDLPIRAIVRKIVP